MSTTRHTPTEPPMITITATARIKHSLLNPKVEHYLTIHQSDDVDSVRQQQLDQRLHHHPTFRAAIQEAQMVLRAAGVAGIRIWNDPDHSLRCTKYTTYRRAPKAARDAHIAAIIRTKKKQYAAGVLPKWQKERLERIPGWSWTAA